MSGLQNTVAVYRVRQNKTPKHENRNFSEMREYYCTKFCNALLFNTW